MWCSGLSGGVCDPEFEPDLSAMISDSRSQIRDKTNYDIHVE